MSLEFWSRSPRHCLAPGRWLIYLNRFLASSCQSLSALFQLRVSPKSPLGAVPATTPLFSPPSCHAEQFPQNPVCCSRMFASASSKSPYFVFGFSIARRRADPVEGNSSSLSPFLSASTMCRKNAKFVQTAARHKSPMSCSNETPESKLASNCA